MAARGRQPGFVMSDHHRTKIANSQILKRLIECAEGEVEMSSTQATVALGLLRKVMPDLQSTQITGPGENGEHVITFKTVYE
jgi:hypothetical protein